jgi:hypothetical protein
VALNEIVAFLEQKTAEFDQFVDEVDCGDDWFIVYGTELTAISKILEYAKEQKRIQDESMAKFMSQPDFGKE